MICKQCGQSFVEEKPWQVFCRPQCRDRWHYQKKQRAVEQAQEARRA
jgi:hypothetical protein